MIACIGFLSLGPGESKYPNTQALGCHSCAYNGFGYRIPSYLATFTLSGVLPREVPAARLQVAFLCCLLFAVHVLYQVRVFVLLSRPSLGLACGVNGLGLLSQVLDPWRLRSPQMLQEGASTCWGHAKTHKWSFTKVLIHTPLQVLRFSIFQVCVTSNDSYYGCCNHNPQVVSIWILPDFFPRSFGGYAAHQVHYTIQMRRSWDKVRTWEPFMADVADHACGLGVSIRSSRSTRGFVEPRTATEDGSSPPPTWMRASPGPGFGGLERGPHALLDIPVPPDELRDHAVLQIFGPENTGEVFVYSLTETGTPKRLIRARILGFVADHESSMNKGPQSDRRPVHTSSQCCSWSDAANPLGLLNGVSMWRRVWCCNTARYVDVHLHVHIHIHIHIRIYIYKYTHIHIYIHAYGVHICGHTCVHIYI